MELTRESFQKEVSEFKSGFAADAFDKAQKSIRLEKRGGIAFVLLDAYQEKVNKLSSPNMLRLYELFLEIDADSSIGAVVLYSTKPTIFVAGADIAELQRFSKGEASVDSLMKLQAVFTALERLKIPSLAAIHGACMGGGLEMSVACDYRMASDAPETKLAVPEVQLGVIPGWGGTQRLPRLLGLQKSLDLVLSGRAVDAKSAKKMGLVDKIVPKEFLEEKAGKWAEELAKTRKKRDYHIPAKDRLLEVVPGGKSIIFDQARKQLMAKTKGHYPAPLRALEVIQKTYGGSIDKGLKVEAAAFTELVQSEISKNLIGIYYLNERVKKDKGVEAAVTAREIKQAAVLGAGVMGGGIAQLFAAKGIRVRMKDLNWDAIAKGYQAAYRVFEKLLKRRKLRPNELVNTMEKIEGTTSYSGFKALDLVVEAVVEDLEIKKKVFKELEAQVGPDTILVSNTSSLSITKIAEATRDPRRVVGMHFFNPVDKMPLVEVIRGNESSDEAVSAVFQLAKKLGKTPIVVKDAPGFVVNRILDVYLVEAVALLAEGGDVVQIDRAMEKFGMPMGPFTLLDEVGLDVATKVAKVMNAAFGERMSVPTELEGIVKEKRLGKKTGRGIYLYENGKQTKPDPEALAKIQVKAAGKLDDALIVNRLVYGMVNEASRCLEEKVARDAADVDIGMIFGTGFAPFRGGLLRYADSIGIEKIVSDLEVFARNYGPRFQPAPYLSQLAVSGKGFYSA